MGVDTLLAIAVSWTTEMYQGVLMRLRQGRARRAGRSEKKVAEGVGGGV